jgi:hypothetical protein
MPLQEGEFAPLEERTSTHADIKSVDAEAAGPEFKS